MEKGKIRIVHVLYRFAYGGLEFVLVNMINSMPSDEYEHIIVSLKEYSPDMLKNINRPVEAYTVNKKDGKDPGYYSRLRKLIRQLKPQILHTYNIGAIDSVVCGLFCGVKAYVHSEHGRDVADPQGTNRKYNLMRKLLSPLFSRFVVVSDELRSWLVHQVGISSAKITRIYNGVDTEIYQHAEYTEERKIQVLGVGGLLVGTVGRLDPVKNHLMLIDAFYQYRKNHPGKDVHLVIVGDGPARKDIENRIAQYGLGDDVILTGARNDIPEIMSVLDLYIQSSIAEGVPMTILEAMSSGLPVLSTSVGGIPEIIDHGSTGYLVESESTDAMQQAISYLLDNPDRLRLIGQNARKKIVENFSIQEMGSQYQQLYAQVLE